jgi:general secretion pathway protein D
MNLPHMDPTLASAPIPAYRWRHLAATRARWLIVAAVSLVVSCGTSENRAEKLPEGAAKPALPRPTTARPGPGAPEDLMRLREPIIISGDGALIGARGETPPAAAGAAGDITLNFVDTDVREVMRAVLGDVLHLNYAVDSKVQATVTLQTSRPLRRDQVLPTLQAALRTSGLALIETADVYRMVSLEEAARSGSAPLIVGQGGPRTRPENANYNVQIFPLKYVAAADMRQMIEPLLPKGATAEVDTSRNLLILSGTGQDLSTATELLRTFDVDWLKGMSFGIFPLQFGTPRGVASDLNTIFGPNGSAPLAGVLRFAPLERMNAILAVSPQRSYLDQARAWIERLDKGGDENTPRLYEYHVQNSRATDLAKVLSELFSSGSVRTVEAQTSPDKAFSALSQSGGAPMMQGQGGGSPAGGSPLGSTPGGGPLGGAAPSATPLSPQPSASTPLTPGVGGGGGGGGGGGAPRPQQQQSLSTALGGAFGADRGGGGGGDFDLPQVRIVADEKNNSLVIFARPREWRMIEDTLKRLDIVPLQVLIEATIAEVTLNDNLSYGTQWFFKKGGSTIDLSQGTAAAAAQVLPGFNYAFLAGGANIVLSALSAVTDVDVVSSPQLLVLDHRVATLQVGSEVPVPTAQIQSTVTAGAPVVNTIQYVNTGVILSVSPRVNQNGIISLDISQEVSDATTTTTSTLNAPTINQRRIETSVSVLDGETVALGGLITENRTLSNSGVPILKDVPIFGSLFGTKDNKKGRTELLILLSPHVLHDAAEARAATDELRNRLHSIAPAVGRIR